MAPTAPTEAASVGDAEQYGTEHGGDEDERGQQGFEQAAAGGLVGVDGGTRLRAPQRHANEIGKVKPDQQRAGHHRAGKQIAHRQRVGREVALRQLGGLIGVIELVAEHDQHGRGRHDLGKRGGGRHSACR
jgi:hypothetical protein